VTGLPIRDPASFPVRSGFVEKSDAPTSRAQLWLLCGVLPLLAGASGLFKVRDPDVWWRVRTGEWIWTHGAIPYTDPYSHTAEGPWNNVEPLGNLILYAFHAGFGPRGLSWAGAVFGFVVALAAVALAREVIREGPRVGPIWLATGLFLAASHFRFGPKPEVLSLAGLALLLLVLHAAERKRAPRLLVLIPLVVLVWGWVHRGSTLSLPVIGAAAVAWIVKPRTRVLVKPALLALLGTVGALLLTPGMARSLVSSMFVLSTPAYTEYLGEWHPLTLALTWNVAPVLLLEFLVWLLVAPAQRRVNFGTLVVLGTGVLAVRHGRFVPLLALAMLPEIAWGTARLLHRHRDALSRQVRPVVLGALTIVMATGAMLYAYLEQPASTWGPGLHHFRRPVHAAEFLAAHPPPGRMFNSFNYGSYLLYALAPAQRVFIDGRNDQVYRPEFFAEVSQAPSDPAVLERLIERYDVTYAVLECTKLITHSYTWLYQNPDWRLVYLDDQAAILVKRTPASRAYLERHAYHELRPDTAMFRALSPDQDPRRVQFAREVLRHVVESPHSIRAHYLAALVHRHGGRREAYRVERERVRELAVERRMPIELP
jgi:hypothetical protein